MSKSFADQVSIFSPTRINKSALLTAFISAGVGSYEWLSIPGGSSKVKSTLSPAISRTKSYGTNSVHTTRSLSLFDSIFPEEQAASENIIAAQSMTAAARKSLVFILFPFGALGADSVEHGVLLAEGEPVVLEDMLRDLVEKAALDME